ncbi:DoxX family membrane protein [soil metagenome]
MLVAGPPATYQADIVRSGPARMILGGLRIVLGWYFLWAFIDKLFGFGFLTASGSGMVDGGTPAQGFMSHASGPFSGFFSSISGRWADYGFMFALLAIGVALITGCGLKLTAIGAGALLALMYLAEFPIGADAGTYTNPLTDDHWVDALAIAVIWFTRSGDTFGLGHWWGGKVGDSWLR